MNQKHRLFITGLISSIILFSCSGNNDTANQPLAQKGILDLSSWDIGEKPVKLNGEWKFYWNQLLGPEDLTASNIHSTWIKVPGVWSDLALDGKNLPKTGYGTYQIDVLLKNTHRVLGLKTYQIGTAYKLWINGQPLITCGIVGANGQSMKGLMKPQTAYFPQGNRVRIVLQVSNFKDRLGGIWTHLLLGDSGKIAIQNYIDNGLDMVLFGVFFIVGLFYVILFTFARKDRSLIYFGICCLMIAIRTLSAGEVFLMTIIPDFNFEINYKIQFLSQCLATPFFVMFIRALFPDEIHKIAVRITQVLMALYGALILSTPLIVYSNLLSLYHIYLIFIILYITVGVVLAVIRKRDEAIFALSGLAVFFISVVNDILYANVIIQTGYLLTYGLILFSMFFIIILSIRFSRLQSAASERIIFKDPDEKLMDVLCGKYGISRRESEVVPFLLKGQSYESISGRLFISVSTLRKHIHSIYKKFGVGNRTELNYFIRTGCEKQKDPNKYNGND